LKFKKIKRIPKKKKTSAILFINIALTAAFIAKIRVFQKLMSKKEHKPTPSHPTNNCKKLSDVTKIA
jgi:hypothetical protein